MCFGGSSVEAKLDEDEPPLSSNLWDDKSCSQTHGRGTAGTVVIESPHENR